MSNIAFRMKWFLPNLLLCSGFRAPHIGFWLTLITSTALACFLVWVGSSERATYSVYVVRLQITSFFLKTSGLRSYSEWEYVCQSWGKYFMKSRSLLHFYSTQHPKPEPHVFSSSTGTCMAMSRGNYFAFSFELFLPICSALAEHGGRWRLFLVRGLSNIP